MAGSFISLETSPIKESDYIRNKLKNCLKKYGEEYVKHALITMRAVNLLRSPTTRSQCDILTSALMCSNILLLFFRRHLRCTTSM